jgi:hypothetical protein
MGVKEIIDEERMVEGGRGRKGRDEDGDGDREE